MKTLLSILFLICFSFYGSHAERLVKTSGMSSANIVDDNTNWCGPGGSGDILNEVDACCWQHDGCGAGEDIVGPLGQPIFQSACNCDQEFLECLMTVNNSLAYDTMWNFLVLGKTKCHTDCTGGGADPCDDGKLHDIYGPEDYLEKNLDLDLLDFNYPTADLDPNYVGVAPSINCASSGNCNSQGTCGYPAADAGTHFDGTCHCNFPKVGDCTTDGDYCQGGAISSFQATFPDTFEDEYATGTCNTGYTGTPVLLCNSSLSDWENSLSSGSCGLCGKDRYVSSGKCIACPPLSTTNGSGKTSRNHCNCPAGYIREGPTSSFVCRACDFGTYATSSTQCTACPSGKTTLGLGSKSANDCVCGRDFEQAEDGSCQSCPVNSSSEPGGKCTCDIGYKADPNGDCLLDIGGEEAEERFKQQDKIAKLAALDSVGGLQPWVGMASGIREAASPGYPPIKEMAGGSSPNLNPIIKWMAGSMAIFALSIIFAILACCTWPIFACCRACGNCGGGPSDQEYNAKQRYVALGLLIIGFLFVFIGAIIGLVSNSLMHRGIDGILSTTLEFVADVSDFPPRIQDIFNEVFDEFDDVVDEVAGLPTRLNSALSLDGINQYSTNVSSLLTTMRDKFQEMEDVSVDLDLAMNDYSLAMTNLQGTALVVSTHIGDLIAGVTFSGGSYTIDSVCLPNPVPYIVPDVTSAIPSFSDAVSSLNDIDFEAMNETIISISNGKLGSNITDTITEQISDAINQLVNEIDGMQSEIQETLDDALTTAVDAVQQMRESMEDIYDQYINRFERIRYNIMALFFALNFVLLFFAGVGFFFKKTWICTICMVFGFFFMGAFWILCAIHFLIVTPLGKVCLVLTDPAGLLEMGLGDVLGGGGGNDNSYGGSVGGTPDGFLNGFDIPTDPEGMIEYIEEVREECRKPDGNLIIFLGVLEQFDVLNQIDQFIEDSGFVDMLDDFDPSDFIGDDYFPNLDLTDQVGSLDTLKEDFEVIFDLNDQYVIDPLDQENTDGYTTISSSSYVVGDCIISHTGLVVDVEADAANRIQQLELEMDDVAADIQTVRNRANDAKTELNNFSIASNAAVKAANDLLEYYGEIFKILEDYVVNLKKAVLLEVGGLIETVKNFIVSTLNKVVSLADCFWLAQNIDALENSICILVIGGMDALWFAAGYMGIFLLFAILGIHFFEKRWLREQEISQYMQDVEMESPPSYDYKDKNNDMYA